jgi:hypothetical protein
MGVRIHVFSVAAIGLFRNHIREVDDPIRVNKHEMTSTAPTIKPNRTELREARSALADHLAQTDWHTSSTLTFKKEQSLEQAQKVLRHFWNRVDGKLFGKASQRYGQKCERACFAEAGKFGDLVHYHLIIAKPIRNNMSDDRFRQFLHAEWSSLEEAGLSEFKPITSASGWIDYITKDVSYFGLDTWDVSNTHIVGRP